MLRSRSIPQYLDDPADWHRFLAKAAKGSIKAPEMLGRANTAYMAALTGDESSPETLLLTDYAKLFASSFPKTPPVASAEELIQLGISQGWFPYRHISLGGAQADRSAYIGDWGKSEVSVPRMIADAVIACLANWSAVHCQKCCDEYDVQYDSLAVVCGMIYLSLTWPEGDFQPSS